MPPPGGFTPQPSRVSAEAEQPVLPHVHLLEVGPDICFPSITRMPSFWAVTCQQLWSAPSLPSEPVCSHTSRVPGQLGAPQLPPWAVGSASLPWGPAEDPRAGVSGVRANGPELRPEADFQDREAAEEYEVGSSRGAGGVGTEVKGELCTVCRPSTKLCGIGDVGERRYHGNWLQQIARCFCKCTLGQCPWPGPSAYVTCSV